MNKALIASVFVVLVTTGNLAASAQSSADPYRLNAAVQPRSQQLEMTLNPNQLRYTGSTLITVDVLEEVDYIVLHAQDLGIVSIQFGPVGNLKKAGFQQLEHALLRVSTGSKIAPGQYELQIQFEDDFNTDSVSMYRVEENGRFHIFSQMEASEAREAFPCFDEPAYKFPWNIALTVPKEMMAVSNTPVENTSSQGEMKTMVFAETEPMPSYLVAVAVGEFEAVEIPGMSVPGRVVTTLGKSGLTGLAVMSTPPILAALENYFDTKYPYPKLDLVATPEFWYGAMENPGAIVYLDRAILIDPENVDAARFRSIVGTLSHEMAHQWFGDVVTMQWWVDLWLNESFASWMGDKIVSQTFPELEIEKSRMSAIFKTMDADSRPSSRPIRAPRTSTDNFLNDIGPSYSKGRVVINMFEKAVGEDQFRAGVLAYMQRHEWGNATAVDFAHAIGVEADFKVAKAFESFMHQPGLPLIEFELLENNRLSVSQRRFVNAGDKLPDLLWTIPLTIRYGIDDATYTQTLVLDSPSTIVDLVDSGDVQWIYPNADHDGYYRWMVSPQLLAPMIDDAQNLLSPMERMGLISNLTAMLNADTTDADEYLAALESFSSERDPYVLAVIVDQLETVRDALVSAHHKVQFGMMVSRLLGPALLSIGFDPVEGESNAVTSIRPRLLEWMMRDARNGEITDEFSARADAFLAGSSDLHSSLVPAALLAAAINGDVHTYELFKKRFENATTPAERAQVLDGLANFESEQILVELQKYSVSEAVRPREMLTIRTEMVKRPEPRELVLDFALENYAVFEERLPGNGLAALPTVARSCSRASAVRAIEFFADPDHQVSGTQRNLDRTTAAIESCAALREREISNADRYFSS